MRLTWSLWLRALGWSDDTSCAAGYTNAYSRLVNAHKPERDPLPEVPSAATFLAQQLGKV